MSARFSHLTVSFTHRPPRHDTCSLPSRFLLLPPAASPDRLGSASASGVRPILCAQCHALRITSAPVGTFKTFASSFGCSRWVCSESKLLIYLHTSADLRVLACISITSLHKKGKSTPSLLLTAFASTRSRQSLVHIELYPYFACLSTVSGPTLSLQALSHVNHFLCS